jgi:glycine C-acetyltransferase
LVLNPDNTLFYKNTLKDIENNDLLREIKTFDVQKNSLKYKNSTVKNFSSNDYLGLSKNKIILDIINKLKIPQISQCSSQLISGSSSKIKNLEKNLSLHRNVQSSLIFPNGYMANLGVLSALGDKDTIIFSDKLNHASIIDGCKLSHSKIEIFQHNDYLNLEDLIKKSKFKRKIIITEGIFSMDGDFSNLKEISKIARENECILIVDDAHGDFILGNENKKNYAGTPDFFNINEQIDIHISSLSKGLGCFGGYVASSELISKYLINKSRPFIFTSALPEFLCELANISLKVSKEGTLQNKLYSNIDYFHKVIGEYPHYEVQKRRFSPIIPIIIGSEKKTIEISRRLLKEGFFIQAIRYPTVKKNNARLRVSISAEHKKKQIRNLIYSLNKITKAI